MATKIGKYIVSTVGEYYPDSQVRKIHAEVYDPKWFHENAHKKGDDWDYAYFKRFGYEELHLGGILYETMTFKAIKSPKGTLCCPYRIASGENIDTEYYKTANEAYKGHLKMCAKYANK